MLDKDILSIMATNRPSPEMRAQTSARICSGPVFVEKDGHLVFSREKTEESYNKMYELFLSAYSKKDA
jgi:hypothetical protein